MTHVAILPVPDQQGRVSYHAVAGERRSAGRTAGEALDALTAQFPTDGDTWIIVQRWRPGEFFSAEQQEQLAELMGQWRSARDRGEALPPDEQARLDTLVEAELLASAKRAAALAVTPQG